MKFNEVAMQVAFESFMKNGYWKDVYEKAPELAKKRLRVAFWGSKYLAEREDLDTYREYRESVEREMTLADAAYLAERFPEGAGKEHYEEMCREREMSAMKTDEKLDAASAILMEGWSDHDRERVEKTRQALKRNRNPIVRYAWLWGAVGGNGEDCEWLGDMFEHGHGIEPDGELAHFWFRKGAFCGHGGCANRLAQIYGEKGPRFDLEKSKFWFAEALRRNCDDAKIDLGARLTTWEEGPWTALRKPELGFKLLVSAAQGDHAGRARFFLGRCYEEGVGVARNLLSAQRQYTAAAREDVQGAREAASRVRKLRRKEGE